MSLVGFVLRWWAGFALLAALAMLAVAILVFEKWLGYAPCHLCYEQRDIYWATAAISALGLLLALFRRPRGTPRFVAFFIFCGFAAETWMAVYHAGVERHWWRGPSTCTGGGAVDLAAVRNLLSGGVVHPPMCDVAVWSFAGVSMAGWNAVAAGALTLVSLAALLRPAERRRGF